MFMEIQIPNGFCVRNNVLFTLNRTTHSSKTLLCVVRFNVNKTLVFSIEQTKLPS